MRVVEVSGPSIAELTLTERVMPEVGYGQVLIQMRAASLNYRDLVLCKTVPVGRIPLSDGCGEVVGVGPGCERVTIGSRVAPIFHQAWIAGRADEGSRVRSLGGSVDGCATEYMCVPEASVVVVPDFLTDAEAATLPCAAVTAWNCLVVAGHVRAGETVLVQGTGGVSIFGLQLAKSMGARVIVTSSSDAKLEIARKLGADELINYRRTPEWDVEAMRMTAGSGVDHVIEVGGSGTFERSLRAAAQSGNISVVGFLSGLREQVDVTSLTTRTLTISGISVGSREMFEQLLKAMEVSRIHPVIDRSFGLHQIQAAYRYLESAAHIGKVVIEFG